MFTWNIHRVCTIILAFTVISPIQVLAHGDEKHAEPALLVGDDTAPAHTVNAFHQALQHGDVDVARALLADKVLIVEGKGVERSADEYASHHMLADMKFMAAVKTETLERQTRVLGNMAYSVSRTKLSGEYNGKAVDLISKETLVLEDSGSGWKIVHIHWSH